MAILSCSILKIISFIIEIFCYKKPFVTNFISSRKHFCYEIILSLEIIRSIGMKLNRRKKYLSTNYFPHYELLTIFGTNFLLFSDEKYNFQR